MPITPQNLIGRRTSDLITTLHPDAETKIRSNYITSKIDLWKDRPDFMTETITAHLLTCPSCQQQYAARIRISNNNGLSPLDHELNSSTEYCWHDSQCNECRKAEQNRNRVAAFRQRNKKPKVQIQCEHCGQAFNPQRSTAKFCSTKCRVAAKRAKDNAVTNR